MFSQVCLTEMCVLLRDAAVAITLVTHQRRATAKFWGANKEEKEASQAELSFVLQVRMYVGVWVHHWTRGLVTHVYTYVCMYLCAQ